MPTSTALPVELTDEIMLSLTSKTDLSSCSLVSHAWRRGSQGQLLRSIYIDPKKDTLRSFLDFVASADAQRKGGPFTLPPFSTIIRAIRIAHPSLPRKRSVPPQANLTDIRDVLRTIPRLNNISLENIKANGVGFSRELDGDIVQFEPPTLQRLSLINVALSSLELVNLFSLFRGTEQLRLKCVYRESFDDSVFPELESTHPLFPHAFEGCRSLSVRHCDLLFVLHFLTQVLRRRKEIGLQRGQQGGSGLLQLSFADTFPGLGSFQHEFGGDIRDLHIDLGVRRGGEMDEHQRILAMNLTTFHSLRNLILTTSFSRYDGSPATIFLAITELIGNCTKSLSGITLNLTLHGEHLTEPTSALALLASMDTELAWMEVLHRTLPKLNEFRWNWIIDSDMAEEGKKEARRILDDGVRERLHELEERGLLRFGPNEVWFV